MEFRILGPVEVYEDGRQLDLGGAKQRALLAVLVLHAGEPVSTDRLIDILWGERQPASAANSVHIYVSRLRKELGDGRILSKRTGYVLAADADELDFRRFERLLAEGRQSLAAGDVRGASDALSSALGLWRGGALSELDGSDHGRLERDRLDELRLEAIEGRIEAELQAGHAADVVAELESLVRANPLREALRAQLMLALYRTGRQSEALETHRQGRKLLSEELGLEPGPALQALERAILTHDSSLEERRRVPAVSLRRRGSLLVAVSAALLLLAAVGVALVLEREREAGLARVAPSAVGLVDPGSHRILAQIPVAGGPTRLARAGPESVWVASDDSRTVSSIDTRTHTISSLVSGIGFPSDVAVGEGAVWIVDGLTGKLARVDPSYGSVVARLSAIPPNPAYDVSRHGFDPVSVAAGAGSVWLTTGTSQLVRVDPRTNDVADTIELLHPLNGVTTGDGVVWVISGSAATLIALDRRGRRTLEIPIVSQPGLESPYPLQVRAGEGFVWVLNGNTASVTKVDPIQRTISATVPIGIERGPTRLAVGAGAAWVANADGTLVRIDPATNAVTTVAVGHSLKDVVAGRASVWVTAGSGLGAAPEPKAPVDAARVQALPTSSCSPITYGGRSKPQFLIATDLPLQGFGTTTPQIAQAVEFVLTKRGYQAGRYAVGHQVCDDSTVGSPVSERCASNARAMAANQSVIGVIGPFSSACAIDAIPVLNAAPDGPVAIVGFSSTYVGLTRGGRAAVAGEPGAFYPTGRRNYARVIAPDDLQAAANAILARRLGFRRIVVLLDPGDYGRLMAGTFARAAARIGLRIVDRAVVLPIGVGYAETAARVRRAGADAVFYASSVNSDSAATIRAIRAALPEVPILLTDGFSDFEQLIKVVGSAVDGATVSVSGMPSERLTGPGREFASAFGAQIGARPGPFSVLAAGATEVLLDAIARSDGTRASVAAKLFETRISEGILGGFAIDENGDTTRGTVTIYRIVRGKARVEQVITPSLRLVR